MIIYANLQSNLPISFRGEDFQIICIIIYNKKKKKYSPAHVGASFTVGASVF